LFFSAVWLQFKLRILFKLVRIGADNPPSIHK